MLEVVDFNDVLQAIDMMLELVSLEDFYLCEELLPVLFEVLERRHEFCEERVEFLDAFAESYKIEFIFARLTKVIELKDFGKERTLFEVYELGHDSVDLQWGQEG